MIVKYLGGAFLIMTLLNFVQCSSRNGLKEDIAAAYEQCNTRVEAMRANALIKIREAEETARVEAAKGAAQLEADARAAQEARREAELRAAAIESRLETLLDRVNQEDQEWAVESVPPYLLPAPSSD